MSTPAFPQECTFTRRFTLLSDVPPQTMLLTASVAGVAVVVSAMTGIPLWGTAIAGLLPWTPVLMRETVWTWRNHGWLALFYLLVVGQGGHFGEHLAQMTQIHLLDRSGPTASGIFGALDIEWVHLIWNSGVLLAAGLLVYHFRANRWLWLTAGIAAWHEIEHVYIMSVYLETGVAGTPGLLSDGGRLGGGLPLTRPDLHFVYNLIETTPLVVAFVLQLRRSRAGMPFRKVE